MTEMMSLKEAKSRGFTRYFTGVKCKNGHLSERTVNRNDCVSCLNARKLKWAAENSEKVAAKSKDWYEKNKDQAKATRAAWRAKNEEKDKADIAAYQAAHKAELKVAADIWRKENPDKVSASIERYRLENQEKILEDARKWRRRNRPKVNAKKRRREAAKLRATPSWADQKKIIAFYAEAERMTIETGIPHHVDHIIPLQSKWVCGLHVHTNLQILPAAVNQSKSNRYWPDMLAHAQI